MVLVHCLGRDDARTGDNFTIDPQLVEQMIADCSSPKGLSLDDMARVRVRREDTVPGGMDSIHAKVALGEATLAVATFGVPQPGSENHASKVSRDTRNVFPVADVVDFRT